MIPGYLDKLVERSNCVEGIRIPEQGGERYLLNLIYLDFEEVYHELAYHRLLKKLPLN